MILLDTSGLLAAIDSAQPAHAAAAAAIAADAGPFPLSPFVLAELDYLVATRAGELARISLLAEVARGAYQLQPFSADDVRAASMVIERHADLGISLADASIIVLAERHAAREVLTLDERHFRVLQVHRKPLRLLPADA